MLLVWYTPPAQTGWTVAQYYANVTRYNLRYYEDEDMLALMWWMLQEWYE